MTTVRVFAYIFGALSVLFTLFFLVFGVGMLVLGAGAGASSAESSVAELEGLVGVFGAVMGVLGGVVLGLAVLGGLFVWFWFWAGNALGRGSTVARVLVTVVLGLDIGSTVLGLAPSVAAAQVDGGATLAVNLALTALAILLIVLLWGPVSARRHFAPAPPAMPAPWGSVPYAIPYAPPAPTHVWPLDASTDRMRPEGGPAPRCRRCGTETERHWVHCGHCGDRLPAVGV